MDLDPQLPDSRPRTAVKLVGKLPPEPDPDLHTASDLDERRLLRLSKRNPPQCPCPLDRILGRDHTEMEQPVVRLRAGKGFDPAEDLAHVPDKDAGDPALEELPAIHLDGRLHPGCAEVPGPRVDVCRAAEAVLHPPAGVLDHPCVEPGASHHREMLAVHRSGVQQALLTVQPGPYGLGEVGRDLQVRREEIRRAGRQDRQHGLRPGHGVNAALDRPVAAPDEDHLSAQSQRAASALRRFAALRHLVPERISNALPRQHLPKFPQTATEALTSVRYNSDPPHGIGLRVSGRRRPGWP